MVYNTNMKHLKYHYKCTVCGKESHASQSHQKMCSSECRKKFYQRLYGRHGTMEISSASVGSISEMMVCSEMLKRGYSVFRTVSQSSFCDVVAIKGKEVLMLEVRTGYTDTRGRISFPKVIHAKIAIPTHYAIYLPENKKMVIREITEEEIKKHSKI